MSPQVGSREHARQNAESPESKLLLLLRQTRVFWQRPGPPLWVLHRQRDPSETPGSVGVRLQCHLTQSTILYYQLRLLILEMVSQLLIADY